jgi:hypothetical protein
MIVEELSDGETLDISCTECPVGAICDKGAITFDNLEILPQFWQDRSLFEHDAAKLAFNKCFGYCAGAGNWSDCGHGYAGRFCNRCEKGFFSVNGDCTACPETKAEASAMTWGAMLGVTICWIALNRFSTGKFEAVDISLIFMQVTSVIQRFSVNWDEGLFSLHGYFNLINFNVDIISPGCVMEWGSLPSFWLSISMPLIGTAIAFARYKFNERRFFNTPYHFGWKLVRPFFGFPRLPASKQELRESRHAAIAHSANLFVILYNNLCIRTFESFVCMRVGDDAFSVLIAAPDMICGSFEHLSGRLIPAVVCLVVYVIGIPLYFFFYTRKMRDRRMLTDPEVMGSMGWMYCRYKAKYCWWETFVLLRRLLLCLCLVFLQSNPDKQTAAALFSLIFCMIGQFWANPFNSPIMNILDILSLTSCLLYVTAGNLFNSEEANNEEQINKPRLANMVLFMSSATIGSMWMVAFIEFRNNRKRMNARDVLRDLGSAEDAEEGLKSVAKIFGKDGKSGKGIMVLPYDDFTKKLHEAHDMAQNKLNAKVSKLDKMYREKEAERGDTEKSRRGESTKDHRLRVIEERVKKEAWNKKKRQLLEAEYRTHESFKSLVDDPFFLPLIYTATELHHRANTKKQEEDAEKQLSIVRRRARRLEKEKEAEKRRRRGEDTSSSDEEWEKFGDSSDEDNHNPDLSLEAVAYMLDIHDSKDLSDRGLISTINPMYLSKWLKHKDELTAFGLACLVHLDKHFEPFLADDSPTSPQSSGTLAKFFRSLVEHFPFVFDWCVTSSFSAVRRFKKISKHLATARRHYGLRGAYSGLFEPMAHSSILFPLVCHGKPYERHLFAEFCNAVLEANGYNMAQLEIDSFMAEHVSAEIHSEGKHPMDKIAASRMLVDEDAKTFRLSEHRKHSTTYEKMITKFDQFKVDAKHAYKIFREGGDFSSDSEEREDPLDGTSDKDVKRLMKLELVRLERENPMTFDRTSNMETMDEMLDDVQAVEHEIQEEEKDEGKKKKRTKKRKKKKKRNKGEKKQDKE